MPVLLFYPKSTLKEVKSPRMGEFFLKWFCLALHKSTSHIRRIKQTSPPNALIRICDTITITLKWKALEHRSTCSDV